MCPFSLRRHYTLLKGSRMHSSGDDAEIHLITLLTSFKAMKVYIV